MQQIKWIFVIILLVSLPSNGIAVNDDETTVEESRSLKTGLDTVIGAVHSRFRSIFGKSKNNQEKRRRTGSRRLDSQVKILPEPVIRDDKDVYMPNNKMRDVKLGTK